MVLELSGLQDFKGNFEGFENFQGIHVFQEFKFRYPRLAEGKVSSEGQG